jgi:predicted ATPase
VQLGNFVNCTYTTNRKPGDQRAREKQRGGNLPVLNKFTLRNFKGIEEVVVDLEDKVYSPVITLIGLNESGKTTILEGLSHFVAGDRSVSGLFDGIHSKTSGAGLIPIHKKAAFTSDIDIVGDVQLKESDVEAIQSLAKTHKLLVDEARLLKPFSVTKEFRFEDSVLKSTTNRYAFELYVRKNRTSGVGQFKKYVRPEAKDDVDLWKQVVEHLDRTLPLVAYFPTFLVDMPSRIYLSEHDGEKPVNRHYRFVFQDILDSLGEGLSLDRHVSNRIVEFRDGQKSANWFSVFFGSPSKAPIDSVFQKISNAVTKEVLGSWQKVFQRAISAKSIFVEWNIDTEKNDLPYASFYVSDGESRYAIHERSLGFRWFFSFLLFTAFKQAKARKTIFVFDEPAANLHAKAQAELLTSFSRIASEGNRIVYSTHSHHMINPRWLSGAYIVENTAVDYDTPDSFGLSTKPTNIRATKYREFVSKFPTRSSYFQPVIEKLEYVSPEIVGSAPFVVVEGITDYFALLLARKALPKGVPYSIMPGTGSGASGPLISQMLGRGEKFLLLLDDDKAGKKEVERYRSDWYLPASTVFTLGELDSSFTGMRLESLLGPDTTAMIKSHLSLAAEPSKKQIGWYLAEACAEDKPPQERLSSDAIIKLTKILTLLSKRMNS